LAEHRIRGIGRSAADRAAVDPPAAAPASASGDDGVQRQYPSTARRWLGQSASELVHATASAVQDAGQFHCVRERDHDRTLTRRSDRCRRAGSVSAARERGGDSLRVHLPGAVCDSAFRRREVSAEAAALTAERVRVWIRDGAALLDAFGVSDYRGGELADIRPEDHHGDPGCECYLGLGFTWPAVRRRSMAWQGSSFGRFATSPTPIVKRQAALASWMLQTSGRAASMPGLGPYAR